MIRSAGGNVTECTLTVHTREDCAPQASFAALQDAKKDANADLTQMIDAIEAKFFPSKGAPITL